MSKVDRIEKISNVRLDANSPWLQSRHRDDQGSEDAFREKLQGSIAKRSRAAASSMPSGEAAVWDGTGATQSLFYENGVDLGFFYRQRLGNI